jgi:beta-lactamase class A
VSYLWSPELDDVLDYREDVAEALGSGVARDLAVVRGRSGNWGLIYDRNGTDRATAERVAATHDRLLRAAIGGRQVLATTVQDEGYTRVHNVGYGSLGSLPAAKARYDAITRLLGPDVHAHLVIEQPTSTTWAVVYKRLGDAESTAVVARRHKSLLAKHGIPASAVPERHLTPVWGATSGSDILVAGNLSAAGDSAGAVTGGTTAAAVISKAIAERTAPVEVPEPDPAPERVAALEPVAAEPTSELPKASPKPALPPKLTTLPAAIATPLRDAINSHVQDLRKRGIIDHDETTSWYVHTLGDDRTWAAINAERSLQCASMVKPYIALAFLHQVDKGRIIYGPVSKSKLAAMIQRSSNSSTNWAIAKVGGPAAVQRILNASYSHLLPETRIVEAIPNQGRTYRNRSSARDYVRFSRALWRDELPQSAELKRLMALPGRDRLTTGAPHIPAGTQVMNKTGSTSHLCGDFGVIAARKPSGEVVPYAIVGIIEKRNRAPDYGAWTASRGRVIRGVSDLTYTVLKKHYGLV